MIENNINFAGDSNGFLSISPLTDTVLFPVHVDGLDQLDIKTIGNFPLGMIRSCSLSEIKLTQNQTEIYQEFFGVSLLPVHLTDSNWTRGFHKREAGFFVSKKPDNIRVYTKVERVIFAGGDSRRVKRVDITDSYINVWLEGPQFLKKHEEAKFQLLLRDGSLVSR
jgi:hypothetical protein